MNRSCRRPTRDADHARATSTLSGDELVGMVSDRDLRQVSRSLMNDHTSARAQLRTAIRHMMSGDLLSAAPEDDIDDLIDLMIENKVGALPIVDGDGALVGIVSYVDILRAAAGKL